LKRHTLRRRQGGIVLLVLLAILALGAVIYAASLVVKQAQRSQRDRITQVALARAKEALIAYAITYDQRAQASAEVPGYLPCPDMGSSEGNDSGNCGTKDVTLIGRLPWKTLGLEPLRDSAGECLWYAVSGSHKRIPKTDMLNWDTSGWLTVDAANGTSVLAGATPGSRAVAIVFAPGAALPGQDRTPNGSAPECGGSYVASAYLDAVSSPKAINNAAPAGTANTISEFIAGAASAGTVNDTLVYITGDEIYNALARTPTFLENLRNLTQHAAGCISEYGRTNAVAGDNRLPWAAPANLQSSSLQAPLTNYDDVPATPAGRLPYRVNDSRSATHNQMANANMLRSGNCTAWTGRDDEWYKHWKDHLFYAVAEAYSPIGSPPCGVCLSVNGVGQYAGIVMFAGRGLAGQTRDVDAARRQTVNYLDGVNASAHQLPNGARNYQSGPSTATFNDILFCIDTDASLGVHPC
jgi:hypothetical protein